MRKVLFAAGLLALGFSSCTKEQTIINTEPAKPPYRVSGLSDVTVSRNPFYGSSLLGQLNFGVHYEYGDQKRVMLHLENLPAGIKDSFSVRSGYPDFSTSVTLYDRGVATGTYAAKLVAHAAGDSVKMDYPFNITVQGDTSCTGYFAGKTLKANSSCSGTTTPEYTASISQTNTGSDTLVIRNYKNNGTDLKVVINCRIQIVSVPDQIISNNLVLGSGQLISSSGLPDNIYLSLSEQDSQGNTTFCTYFFEFK